MIIVEKSLSGFAMIFPYIRRRSWRAHDKNLRLPDLALFLLPYIDVHQLLRADGQQGRVGGHLLLVLPVPVVAGTGRVRSRQYLGITSLAMSFIDRRTLP